MLCKRMKIKASKKLQNPGGTFLGQNFVVNYLLLSYRIFIQIIYHFTKIHIAIIIQISRLKKSSIWNHKNVKCFAGRALVKWRQEK